MGQQIEAYDPNACNHNHDGAEGEEDTDTQLLATPNFHKPQDSYGDAEDCLKSEIVIPLFLEPYIFEPRMSVVKSNVVAVMAIADFLVSPAP